MINNSHLLQQNNQPNSQGVPNILAIFRQLVNLLGVFSPRPKTVPEFFYVNPRSDIFQIQIGNVEYPLWPAYVLSAVDPAVLSPLRKLTHHERQALTVEQHMAFEPAKPFPSNEGAINPPIFSSIKHLAFTLSLAPSSLEFNSPEYKIMLSNAVAGFFNIHVKSTLQHLPSVSDIDIIVHQGDNDKEPSKDEPLVLKDWHEAPIRESDGVAFGAHELRYLESEFRMCFMFEYIGAKVPNWRLVVKVPEDCRKIAL